MNPRPLYKKLGIDSAQKFFLHQEPLDYFEQIQYDNAQEHNLEKDIPASFDFVHAFISDYSELKRDAHYLKNLINKNGTLWISWPKSSSALFVDLKRDLIRLHFLDMGLVDVKVCSFNTEWSSIKFVYRLVDR